MITNILFKIYKLESRIIRRLIVKYIVRSEGGEFYSKTLRRIYFHYHNIEVGMYSYGGCFSLQNISPRTRIGRYCSFARNVYIVAGNHPKAFKSLHPFFFNPDLGYVSDLLTPRARCVIENDVWIGQGAIILPSAHKIGNGAIIGAGSVVTKNVPPYAVVAGNPARIIKFRFSEETIEALLKSAWWDNDIVKIKENKTEFATFVRPFE